MAIGTIGSLKKQKVGNLKNNAILALWHVIEGVHRVEGHAGKPEEANITPCHVVV